MQLEELIAKELATIIKENAESYVDRIMAIEKAIDTRFAALETKDDAPDDVVDSIAKAIALLAEAPPLTQARDNGPVVVQFTPPLGKRVKTITTRRDDKGNLVARVVED